MNNGEDMGHVPRGLCLRKITWEWVHCGEIWTKLFLSPDYQNSRVFIYLKMIEDNTSVAFIDRCCLVQCLLALHCTQESETP